MPVILREEDYGLWLDADPGKLEPRLGLLGPYPAAETECYPVGAAVNSPRNQGAGLIEPSNVNAP